MDDQHAVPRVVCIGGAVIDRKYQARAAVVPGTSNPADGTRGFGGVARNVAENLARLGHPTTLLAILGDDAAGRDLLGHAARRGIDTAHVIATPQAPTAEYVALLSPERELVLGIADMAVLDLFTPDHLARLWPQLDTAAWVFADCNLPRETLARLISQARSARFSLAVDAVSTAKAARLPADLAGIDLLFMNLDEARAIQPHADPLAAALGLRDAGAREAIVTMGARGIAVAGEQAATTIPALHATLRDVTGAGDALIAGTLHAKLSGTPTLAAARMGMLLATLTTETASSVHESLSPCFLAAHIHRIEGFSPA